MRIINKYLDRICLYHYDTYLHCVRTALITSVISKPLNLSPEDTEYLLASAVCHDLGKINIPIDILDSPKSLQPHEWMIVKQHPQYGANMLKKHQYYDRIADGVASHHERFDGNGYPYNLKKEEIPWQGRVIAVADSLDAMVTFRHYQNVKTFDQALRELRKMSEKQFDPYIISKLARWDRNDLIKIVYSPQDVDLKKIIVV